MPRNSEGFTLIELVVVLGIFGLVMLASYSILETTIEADRRVHEATLTGKVGEAILNQMRRDLQGTIWRGLGENIFRGESRGEEENAEDTIDFLTTSPVPEPDETIPTYTGEVSSVGYALKAGEDGDFTLFRRVAWDMDVDPLDTGDRIAIYNRVKALDFRFLDAENNWVDDWDSSNLLPEVNESDFPFLKILHILFTEGLHGTEYPSHLGLIHLRNFRGLLQGADGCVWSFLLWVPMTRP